MQCPHFGELSQNGRDIGGYAFYGCYSLGESDPETTVIFAGTQSFSRLDTWDGVGTSGGRAPVTVFENRLQFANGNSGVPE